MQPLPTVQEFMDTKVPTLSPSMPALDAIDFLLKRLHFATIRLAGSTFTQVPDTAVKRRVGRYRFSVIFTIHSLAI